MLSNTWQQVRLAFWDMIIYMLSENKFLRMLLRSLYELWRDLNILDTIVILGVVCITGFSTGVFLYLVTSIIG
jgi:hypothetical protein